MFEEIKKLMIECANVDNDKITLDASLKELGIDSLYAVEMLLELEEHYSIKIDDIDMEKLKTVEDVVKLVESKTR